MDKNTQLTNATEIIQKDSKTWGLNNLKYTLEEKAQHNQQTLGDNDADRQIWSTSLAKEAKSKDRHL